MNDNEEDNLVPGNRYDFTRVGPFKTRNLIEAILFTIPVLLIICLLPFITQAKILFCLMFGGLTFFFSVVGINNRSLLKYLHLKKKYKSSKRTLKLRSLNDEPFKQERFEKFNIQRRAWEVLVKNDKSKNKYVKAFKGLIFYCIKYLTE